MPRGSHNQQAKLKKLIIPSSLTSFETSIRTTDPSNLRLCSKTTLITRAQAPYYLSQSFELTHRNIIVNDLSCIYAPDASFDYLLGQVAIKWPYAHLLRNVSQCIDEVKVCEEVVIREPNCTNPHWLHFLFDHNLMEIDRQATIQMSRPGRQQTNVTQGIPILVLENFSNYSISSTFDSQIVFIKALELTNSQLTEVHVSNGLKNLKFLNASNPKPIIPEPYDFMTTKTHKILSIVNTSLIPY